MQATDSTMLDLAPAMLKEQFTQTNKNILSLLPLVVSGSADSSDFIWCKILAKL